MSPRSIINNVSLCLTVSDFSGTRSGRITSSDNTTNRSNNYARSDLLVNGVPVTNTDPGYGVNAMHVANLTATSNATDANGGWSNLSFWQTTLGWDFVNVWEWRANGLPVLRGFPAGTHNPRVP